MEFIIELLVELILEGTIEMQRIYCNGKYIVIKKLSKGEVFGEALVFSEKSFYPLTVLAVNDCLIMYIKKEHHEKCSFYLMLFIN